MALPESDTTINENHAQDVIDKIHMIRQMLVSLGPTEVEQSLSKGL